MAQVKIKINNREYEVEQGITILEACRRNNLKVPTLCYMKEANEIGACRVCVVEVKNARSLIAACVFPVSEGMEIQTHSKRVMDARKTTLELILSNHNKDCTSCVRSHNCELQNLSNAYGCNSKKYEGEMQAFDEDETEYLVRDNTKCVLCRRCVSVCSNQQVVSVIGVNDRGYKTKVGSAFDRSLSDAPCVKCGQCIINCPTGALREKDDIEQVLAHVQDPDKYVVVAPAPAVRVALGEEFNLPIGTNVEGKLVAALKAIGFDKVFDVNWAADLTIMEEGTEFLHRLKDGGVLPLITSCSPGWINYVEQYYPEMLPHISSCKSPQQMLGATIKSYYATKFNIPLEKLVVVSIMPCVAKKSELSRDEQQGLGGFKNVDYSLTTRELARMIKRLDIEFNALKDDTFDSILGEGSTAGLIFGATGGVMEAALRTLKEVVEGEELKELEFKGVRGTKGIKKATVEIGGKPVKVCVAHGIENAKEVLEEIKNGADYSFVEIMCCSGGCVNGGGQPIQNADTHAKVDVRKLRAAAMYKADEKSTLRKSHQNKEVKTLYDEYYGEPGSYLAHTILHTTYKDKKN